jgi:hypothetical protein
MTGITHEQAAMSVWRSGFFKDPNKVRQAAKENMRRLIASDLVGMFVQSDPDFDRDAFLKACGI